MILFWCATELRLSKDFNVIEVFYIVVINECKTEFNRKPRATCGWEGKHLDYRLIVAMQIWFLPRLHSHRLPGRNTSNQNLKTFNWYSQNTKWVRVFRERGLILHVHGYLSELGMETVKNLQWMWPQIKIGRTRQARQLYTRQPPHKVC